MKKLLVSLACLTLIGTSYAHEHGWMVSLKQGYFVPQEKVLRDIFSCSGSKGGYFVEGALRYNVWDELYLELNGSYFGRKGHALIIPTSTSGSCGQHSCGCGECVSVKIPTVGFVVKYYWWFRDYVSAFLGGGIKGFFVKIHNDSPYVNQCDNKNAVGGFVHTGLLFDVYKGLFFELFADYLGTRLKCPCADTSSVQYKLNVGGFAGGVGIGYKF